MLESILQLALSNFLSPVILFFDLGFAACLVKSDLEIPGNVSKFIAIYLMMAIGYKGGYALGQQELDSTVFLVLLSGAVLSFVLPFLSFFLLKLMSGLRPTDRAAIAAHYGSVSLVTFITASELLQSVGVAYDSWLIAVLAIMETPAIFAGLVLVNLKARNESNHVRMDGTIWREIFLNGSVVILVGSFIIGAVAGEPGMQTVSPFFVDIFKGVLCLFMLDIGMVAAAKIGSSGGSGMTLRLAAYGIIMPLIASVIGLFVAALIGLSQGSMMLFAVLCASASYIAVPAALRIALPQANLSLAITLSLAVTFPFNIIFGLPLYLWLSEIISAL